MKTKTRFKRIYAIILCLFILLTTVIGIVTFAANSSAESFAEKSEREAQYEKMYDMDNLTWKGDYNSARNYLYWQKTGSHGGIQHKNYIHVYAFEGETLTFGSNVYNSTLNNSGLAVTNSEEKKEIESTLGEGASIDIVLIDLDGVRIPYDVNKDTGKGYIGNVQTEVLAKTMEQSNGNSGEVGDTKYEYTPLTYTVKETGVYTFEFHSYSGSGTGTQRNKNGNFDDPSKWGGGVTAWDISVFNESGAKETGRVYADYLDFQQDGAYNVKETYYILTTDSYIYKMDWNGATPYTYNFFANNRGLIDNATGNILYKSVKEIYNARFDYTYFGATYTYPGTKDTDLNKSYYIFFEMPDEKLKGHMYDDAIPPDPATNIHFKDTVTYMKDIGGSKKEVTERGSYEGMGGWFEFDVKEATTATLCLEFNNIGSDGKTYAPVEISGVVKPYSTNRLYWDGKDGNGEIIPAGDYSIENISYTIITKAGEIHFPIHDVEASKKGFSFTRVNHIYDREGNQLDADDKSAEEQARNIYSATKSVIYYDSSAIYYGERVGSTGYPESEITITKDASKITSRKNWVTEWTDTKGALENYDSSRKNQYYEWDDMKTTGGEYKAYTADYRKKNKLRVGDHSHTSNSVKYYDEHGNLLKGDDVEAQSEMINWLDSVKNPVGIASASTTNTFDFGIQNYWTFIPAQPVTVNGDTADHITIVSPDGEKNDKVFNLTGQVFYDEAKTNGEYNPQADKDILLEGVTLNLYKEVDTGSEEFKSDLSYIYVTKITDKPDLNNQAKWEKHAIKSSFSEAGGNKVYKLIKSEKTPSDGRSIFTNLTYDSIKGTGYVYEVERPNNSYNLTSYSAKGKLLGTNNTGFKYGSYVLYEYDADEYGTEIQVITVGGDDGLNPESAPKNKAEGEESNHTVTAIDVGYHFETYETLTVKKDWQNKDPDVTTPVPAIFELSYTYKTDKNLTNEKGEVQRDSESNPIKVGATEVYALQPLSNILNSNYTFNYLPTKINVDGKQRDVADWYISAEYYVFDGKIFKHTFDYDANSQLYMRFVARDWYYTPGAEDSSLGNLDKPETMDWNAVSAIPSEKWEEALAAGTVNSDVRKVVAPFNSVLDRNPGSAENTITITNATEPSTVEIYKYTTSEGEEQALENATFRIYKGTIEQVKEAVANGTADKIQIASATTRRNGRVAFSGLNPDEVYTVREVFPPSGYQIVQEYYEIHGKNETNEGDKDNWYKFDSSNYCFIRISNVRANDTITVRKMISGRAWNTHDSFTFDVAVDPDSVNVTHEDQNLYSENYSDLVDKFVQKFNASKDDITINYNSDFITVKNTDSAGNVTSTTTRADTKQGLPLITSDNSMDATLNFTRVNDEFDEDADISDTNQRFVIDGVKFPVAGDYTVKITENDLDESSTLTKSPRVFTLTVTAVRVLNSDVEPDDSGTMPQITLSNSHLEASVTQIQYQPNGAEDDLQGYAGTAPTFINTYTVKDVVQSTGYAILKKLTGRKDDKWLNSDSFTFTVTGADDVTTSAIENGELYFEGLHSEPDKEGKYQAEKTIVITDDQVNGTANNTHKFDFTAIDFHNINFPVEWVDDDGNLVRVNENGQILDSKEGEEDKVRVDAEGNPIKATARTQDVVYTLKIKEKIPAETNGITYSNDEYTLKITLKNAVLNDDFNISEGEFDKSIVDGIIDELDFMLYKNDEKDPSATCETDQHVAADFNEWKTYNFDGNNEKFEISRYYIDSDNKIHDVKVNERGELYEDVAAAGGKTQQVVISEAPEGADLVVKRVSHTGDHTMTFENKYNASGIWSPVLSKTLEGRDWASDDTFEFSVSSSVRPEGVNARDVIIPSNISVTKGEGNEQTYTNTCNIKLPMRGTYVFEIIEENAGNTENNITYDEVKYYVTVDAQDNDDGTLTPKVTGIRRSDGISAKPDEVMSFTNIYNPTPTDFAPEIVKIISGDVTPSDKEFTFNIAAKEDNPDGAKLPDNTVASVTGAETASFENINFTKAGTYVFEITENEGSESGYQYDNSVWTLTVEVEDVNSELKVVRHTYEKKDGTSSIEHASFTNNYSVKSTKYAPSVVKTISGEMPPSNKTFTFNISENEGNPEGAEMPDIKTAEVTGAGTASFGEITFKKAGTYTFGINEKQGSEAGYKYDGSEWTLTLVVKDNDSQLEVESHTYAKTGEISNNTGAEFNNIYSVTETVYAPLVNKTVTTTSGNVPDDEKFTFSITANEENQENGAILPDTAEATVTGSGDAEFGNITFKKTGTYKFEISEQDAHSPGYTYDKSVWTLTVKVVDNDSQLEVESHTYEKTETEPNDTGAEFTNEYSPAVLSVSKTVVNADETEPDDSQEFKFNVTLVPPDGSSLKGSYPYVIRPTYVSDETETSEYIKGNQTINENDGAYTATFTLRHGQTIEISDLPDKTEYTVEEIPIPGYSTVKAGDTGTLEISKTSSVSFENTLLLPNSLTISKTVTGESGDRTKDWTFNIVLTPPDGVVLADSYNYTGTGIDDGKLTLTKSESGDGTYSGNITIKHGQSVKINKLPDGTKYKVTEKEANRDGYESNVTPDITPNDGIAEGILTESKNVYFSNQNPIGTGNLIIRKIVKGDGADIDKEFEFTVTFTDPSGNPLDEKFNYDGDKKGIIKSGETVFLKNGQSVNIAELPLGTKYKVIESEANQNGYVTTSEGESGQFESTNDTKNATFTNSRGTGTLTISKAFDKTGDTPLDMDRQFNFRVKLNLPDDISDDELTYSYVSNSEVQPSGNIKFVKDSDGNYTAEKVKLKFGEIITISGLIDGTTYNVTEENIPGYSPNIEYTPSSVESDWGGPINSASTLFKNYSVNVVNTYNLTSTDYTPKVKKTVTGNTPSDKTFTFNISEKSNPNSGATLPETKTTTVKGSGSASFEKITFTKAGTYTFEIKETQGDEPGYSYDGSVWTLTVEVEDVDSILTVKSHKYTKEGGTPSNDEAEFNNVYSYS